MLLNYSDWFSKKLWLFVVGFVGFIDCVKLSGQGSKPSHDKSVVCYIGTWSVYRPGRGSFTIEDIPPNLCTHVVYAFVGLNATTNTLRSIDPYYDLEENYGKGSFKKITRLKSKNPHLKITLAVGGWNEGSLNYSTMALTSQTRGTFIKSVVDYVVRYNFDGFDLDWEFPAMRGGRKEDKENFALLVKELKGELSKRNLILTAALGAAPDTIDNAYDIPEISKYLDLIHFMCYDYHGPWDKTVGVNAPLKSSDTLSVEYSIKHILKLGAPPEKLVLGIPAYGHTFISIPATIGLGSDVLEPGDDGPFTKQKGFQGYNEICMDFEKNNWQLFWDENSLTPYAVRGNLIVSYDDERSIAEKVKLGLKYKLGGFMIWSIDTDDFHGDCENKREQELRQTAQYSYPLLKSVHKAIEDFSINDEGIDDVNDNEIHQTTTKKSNGDISSSSILTTVIVTLFSLFV